MADLLMVLTIDLLRLIHRRYMALLFSALALPITAFRRRNAAHAYPDLFPRCDRSP